MRGPDRYSRTLDNSLPVLVQAGVVVDDGGTLRVNLAGAPLSVLWPVGVVFSPGDVVRVLRSPDRVEVLPPVLAAPRPATGTVTGSAAGGLVPVTTTAGDVQARYTGTAPALGAAVRLDWAGTQAWVWPGTVATATAPVKVVTVPDAPPGPDPTGTLNVLAVDSGSWAVHRGAWSTTTGTDVMQGSWRGVSYTGAWWYGSRLTQLAGRTPRAWRVWVPGRRPGMGQHGAPVALDLYVHDQAVRGATEPARVLGPWSLTLPPAWGGGWVSPPSSFVQRLINNGGGLAIAGAAYAGVAGLVPDPRTDRTADPRSGRVEIEWSRS